MGVFYEGLGDELSLFVRQSAWLAAIPRTKDARGTEQKQPARVEAFRAGGSLPLPPLEAGRHVYDWLMEAGPAVNTGMGQVPLSWSEIDRWASRTFQQPTAWETRTLRRLSCEYLAELTAAEDPHRAAPWVAIGLAVDQDANERQLRSVLG